MKFEKSNLTVDGNKVHVSMPFAKVDKKERLVSGWATLDNPDTQGDIVLAKASAKAFSRARGNIREMHQPLAVGRMVDFVEKEFYDKDDKKFYSGIFVTARVSEGAEDTWKKVLDGTLTGFSIGGEVTDSSNEFSKDAGRSYRLIKDYDLVELSLVDNPANQKANFESFQKIYSMEHDDNGSVTVKGMAVESNIENVFICTNHDDEVVTVKDAESDVCPDCEKKMQIAGWFESGEDRSEKVGELVTKFLSPAKEAAPISSEGGVEDMGILNKKAEEPKQADTLPPAEETSSPNPGETHEDGTLVDPNAVASVPVEEETDTAASVEEVEDEESNQISKKIDELHTAVKQSLEESQSETLKKVTELEQRVTDATRKFLAKASELETKIDGYGQQVETQKQRLAEFETSLNKMNRSEALKKSAGNVTSPVVPEQNKTFWGNAFSD